MEYPEQAKTNFQGFDEGVEAEVPTHENSIKKPAPSTPAEETSPANIGDASC